MRILSIIVILFLLSCSKQEPIFTDLSFENKCIGGSDDCVWKKSWGKKTCCNIQTIDKNSFLEMTGTEENSVSFIEQEAIIPERNGMKILTVSAMIKTIDVKGKGAGLNIGIYDGDNELIANKDMGGFYSLDWEKGYSDWKKAKLSIVSPTNAYKVKIGAILYGKGKVYFDDFEIQLIDIKENRNDVAYIAQAIDIIRNNSLVRDSVNFEELQAKASSIATASNNDLALEYLLGSLKKYGDDHSFLMKAEEAKSWEANENPESTIDFPSVRIEKSIGVITVPPFHSGNEKLMIEYADSLHKGLSFAFSNELKGWIVDLRKNTGGNMEPMIVGLGPLLDSGKIGSLVDINGENEYWYYKDGHYYWEKEKGISLDDPFTLNKKLPVVVLTSEQTGSSGEVVVISFIGNTKTTSMGKPTWGLTTGNGEFELEDGTKLFMASTKMVDRNGIVYSSKIQPDYVIEDDNKTILSAIDWINNNQ